MFDLKIDTEIIKLVFKLCLQLLNCLRKNSSKSAMAGSSGLLTIWLKRNTSCSMSYIKKINSFRDMAFFGILYLIVERNSQLQNIKLKLICAYRYEGFFSLNASLYQPLNATKKLYSVIYRINLFLKYFTQRNVPRINLSYFIYSHAFYGTKKALLS